MIYLLLMLYSNILVMGNDFVIVSIYWIVVHTVFKQCFWWPVYKGKKIAVYNFVAPGILSPTWWFLHPRPWNEMKKIFKPRMVCQLLGPCTLYPAHLCDCAYSHSTVSTVPTVWLCIPYPLCYTLSIIWSHKSTSYVSMSMCMAGGRCGNGQKIVVQTQIIQLVSNGNDW